MSKKQRKRATPEEQIKKIDLQQKKLEAKKALVSARAAYRAIK